MKVKRWKLIYGFTDAYKCTRQQKKNHKNYFRDCMIDLYIFKNKINGITVNKNQAKLMCKRDNNLQLGKIKNKSGECEI